MPRHASSCSGSAFRSISKLLTTRLAGQSADFGHRISSSNVGRQPQIAGSDITLKFPRIAHFSDTEPRTLSPTPALFAPSTDHSNCAFYLTELSKVVNELLIESKTLLLNQQWVNVKTWEPRYLAWYESLPNSLVVAENGPAHIIAMHMWYHGSIIRTFQPILAVGRSEQNTMRLMCQQAAETITGLFRRYRSLYGLMGLNALVVQAVLDAYSVQLQSFPSSCEDLLTVIEAFQQLSHAHGWARTCLLKLEAQILQSHVAEPAAIIDALFGRCGIMPHPTTMSACPVTAPSAAYYDQVVPSFSIESPESQYDFLWEAAPRPPPRGGHYFFSPFA